MKLPIVYCVAFVSLSIEVSNAEDETLYCYRSPRNHKRFFCFMSLLSHTYTHIGLNIQLSPCHLISSQTEGADSSSKAKQSWRRVFEPRKRAANQTKLSEPRRRRNAASSPKVEWYSRGG